MELKLVHACSLNGDKQGLNRTLWNWNSRVSILFSIMSYVLIVLYGIETRIGFAKRLYVIEVLIVLYGIETTRYPTKIYQDTVLIVLYGIETLMLALKSKAMQSLNRTLWNWNAGIWWCGCLRRRLNRTLWNWNSARSWCHGYRNWVLIVLYGIETWKRKDW